MTTNTTTVSSRKRRRPAVVCTECRRRKIACDLNAPCAQCMQHNSACTYDTPDHELRAGRRTRAAAALAPHCNSNSDTTVPEAAPLSTASNPKTSAFFQPSVGICGNSALRPAYAIGSGGVNGIQAAPSDLQQSVAGPTVNGTNLPNLSAGSDVPAAAVLTYDLGPDGRANTSVETASSPSAVVAHTRHRLNGRFDKSRLFGQSHWMTSLLNVRILRELSFPAGLS